MRILGNFQCFMAVFKLEINVTVPKFDHIVIVYKISKHLSIQF